MDRNKAENFIGKFLYFIALVVMVCYTVTLFGKDIWYDEVFSVFFASSSFRDIVRLTSQDVHPPLYYFYLKLMTGIGTGIFGRDSFIFFAKLSSFIPWAVIFGLAIFPIRKRLGILTGGMFAFLITAMPKLGSNYAEIRMYSFAMMLLTVAFVCTLGLLSEKKDAFYFTVFTLTGIMTAYTQYYACIAMAGLYICYGVFSLCSKRKKQLKTLILCAVLSAVAYLPWIKPLFTQISRVSGNYWIQPLTIRSIPGCLKFLFLPWDSMGAKGYVIACLSMLAIGTAYVVFLTGKPGGEELFISLCGPAVLFVTVVSGFVLSLAGRPIFVYRYMIPALGVFYLSAAFVLCSTSKKTLLIVLAAAFIFILSARYTMGGYIYDEKNKVSKMSEAQDIFDDFPENAIVITNFDHVCTLMSYYLPDNKVYLYEASPDSIVELMYNRDDFELSRDALGRLVKGDAPVYFFGSFNSREDLLALWEQDGIGNTALHDSVLVERYYFNIYRLFDEKKGN